jgi:hypothetical protein
MYIYVYCAISVILLLKTTVINFQCVNLTEITCNAQ